MTEILTESFCERCGTRYTFESSAPRKSRLGRVRTLSKGVRNFVLSDESSFSEAMAEARSEEELAATTHQLDAFHRTFNFCLTCRQYTCGDCWNVAEGRCLTCAPMPGHEEPASLLDLAPMALAGLEPATEGNGHAPGDAEPEAWPEMDLSPERLARVLDLTTAEPSEPIVADHAQAEAGTADMGIDETGAFAAAVDEVLAEQAAAERTAAQRAAAEQAIAEQVVAEEGVAEAPILGVAPGQSLDDAIAAYEARMAAEEAAQAASAVAPTEPPAVEPGPVLAPEAGAAPVVAEAATVEVEPITAAPEPEPMPVEAEPVAAAEPESVVPAEPEPVSAAPAPALDDHVEQPTWPAPAQPPAPDRPAPVAPPAPAPRPWLTVAPDDASAPQWPTAPQWPSRPAGGNVPTTIAGRMVLPQADASAMWAASAQEVLGAAPTPLASTAPATAQPCVSCGLSLSANARFCRRCGSRQG